MVTNNNSSLIILRFPLHAALLAFLLFGLARGAPPAFAQDPQAVAKAVGTVKSISGRDISLTAETGGDVTITVQDGARLLRIEPGQTDLKTAVPLQLQDLQPGDRVLVRGKTAADGKSLLAVSVIAMKKAEIADKRTHERDEWQMHSVGGLVNAADPAGGSITIATTVAGVGNNVNVKISKETVLRRYAPGSVKFDDAKPAPVDQIKVGDQLRARGARSADGSEVTADEVVSGSFRNIAGTIGAIDAGAGTISVTDLATKKPISVKINSESQLRKLPLPMAQRIAARLKGGQAGGQSVGQSGGQSNAQASPATAAGQRPPDHAGASAAGGQYSAGGPSGGGGQGQGGGDLQQAISRVPMAVLAELQKGDAVMIVATPGTEDGGVTAITLLAGVEPILQAAPNSGQSILTPWSLSGAPGGDAAAQ
jgi:Domain of unknown function (DUF5666)